MKSSEELLADGRELVAEYIISESLPEVNRLDIYIEPVNLKVAVRALVDHQWGYLMTITGMDHPPVENEQGELISQGMLEGLYHFANEAAILTLRVKVGYDQPFIDSICEDIPSATIYEREFMELFGVDLVGTPDTSRLVLPDDWPENVFPLRKSFTSLQAMIKEGKEN